MNGNPLSSSVEQFLFGVQAAEITEFFLRFIVVLFLFAVVLNFFGIWKRLTRETPTLLTSIGILGTFVGIVVGLMHCDPQNIDGSIATLLSGLKTAFITSLVGMGGAILFKIVVTLPWLSLTAFRHRPAEDITGTGPEEILKALLDQNRGLGELRTAITGTEETSLIGQLKLIRTDHNDVLAQYLRNNLLPC